MNPATFEAIAVCLRSIVGDEEFAAHKFRRPFNLHLADDADADECADCGGRHAGTGTDDSPRYLKQTCACGRRLHAPGQIDDRMLFDLAVVEHWRDKFGAEHVQAAVNDATDGRVPTGCATDSEQILKRALTVIGADWEFDLRAMARRWRYEGVWRPANDRLEAKIRSEISESCGGMKRGQWRALRYSLAAWKQARNAIMYEREFDPMARYLDELPAWDGVARIDDMLDGCLGVPDSADKVAQWASRYLTMGVVKRCRQPGYKLDVMPVLIGGQGAGKSTFLAWTLPPELRDTGFTDSVNLSETRQKLVEALQGKIIAEVGEMSGATRGEQNAIKQFLTSTNHNASRLSYRENAESMPVRYILFGTANDDGRGILPNDATGNRRFACIDVDHSEIQAIRDWLDEHRPQLWAEAVARVDGGEQVWFPDELKVEQAARNELHRAADLILEDAVKDYLETCSTDQAFTLAHAAEATGLIAQFDRPARLPRRESARLARALRAQGATAACQSRTCLGGRARHWHAPSVAHGGTRNAVERQMPGGIEKTVFPL